MGIVVELLILHAFLPQISHYFFCALQGTFRGESLSIGGVHLSSSQETSLTGYLESAFFGGAIPALTRDCGAFPLDTLNEFLGDVSAEISSQGRSISGDASNQSEFLSCLETSMLQFPREDINERLFCSFNEVCSAQQFWLKKISTLSVKVVLELGVDSVGSQEVHVPLFQNSRNPMAITFMH